MFDPSVLLYLPTLQYHRTVPSNPPLIQCDDYNMGILHVSLLDAPSIKLYYCIITYAVLPTHHQNVLYNGYNLSYFIMFSSKAACLSLNPRRSITNTIYPKQTEAEPPNIISYLFMSMTLLPPPTAPFFQTTSLLNLMKQQMHQNAELMAQLQRQASLRVHPHDPASSLSKMGWYANHQADISVVDEKLTKPKPITLVYLTGHRPQQKPVN